MGVIKGIGTVIGCILLFAVLSLLSVAFLVNSTVLNAGFVKTQVNKLDISEITQDFIDEQLVNELPQDSELLFDVAYRAVEYEETAIKAQINTLIDSTYAYILSEADTLELTISLAEIKQDLQDHIWDIAIDYLKAKMANMTEAEVDAYVQEIANQIPEDILPRALALLPYSLRNEIVTLYLKELGGRGFFEELSLGLDFLVEDEVRSYVEDYFNGHIDDIPDSFNVDNTVIDAKAMQIIQDVRLYISYFKTGYVWLIVITFVIIGLIFLINWKNIKASLLAAGITLLVFGILDLTGILVLRFYAISQNNSLMLEIPEIMQGWARGLIKDTLFTALPLIIAVLTAGIIMMVLSFVIKKPGEPAE